MTEAEWFAGTNAYDLLTYRRCRNDRKRRLSACASARRVLHLVSDKAFHAAVDTAERYADGLATDVDRNAAKRAARKAYSQLGGQPQFVQSAGSSCSAVLEKAYMFFKLAIERAEWAEEWHGGSPKLTVRKAHCDLVRDVFGNPFRSMPSVAPAWLAWNNGSICKMAQAIYDDRAFDHLPLLADALEDAGCADADILAHCRGLGPHVRGCWVVDLLLGKAEE